MALEVQEKIYTVTELTRELKALLETQYASVWLSGEVSNFRPHSSGHYYFTLKDEFSQISAVMFRGSNRFLKFQMEDGIEVMVQGHLSLYEVRGNYQIIVEYMEPKGLGALQLAFEQLKKKLEKEGLFDESRKRPLPFCPQTVGIITSPTGAVIQDMVRVLHRRHPGLHILFYPVTVQGEAAAPEIVRGLEVMNLHGKAEVLIVGRGGGSLEDLWAFNTEAVARAIHASAIPVISAVGHETDFTIADFVADLRAPTPSAAAEFAVPVVTDLLATIREHRRHLVKSMRSALEEIRGSLKFWISHLKHPKRRLEELSIHLDDLTTRLRLAMEHGLEDRGLRLFHLSKKLEVLSPLSILSRGYSIVRKLKPSGEEGAVLKDAKAASAGDLLSIRVMNGSLKAEVKGS
jgi:exodeoxyribonuclease VII large subunit